MLPVQAAPPTRQEGHRGSAPQPQATRGTPRGHQMADVPPEAITTVTDGNRVSITRPPRTAASRRPRHHADGAERPPLVPAPGAAVLAALAPGRGAHVRAGPA